MKIDKLRKIIREEIIREMPHVNDGKYTIDFRVEEWDIVSDYTNGEVQNVTGDEARKIKGNILRKIAAQEAFYIHYYHILVDLGMKMFNTDKGLFNDIVLINMYKNIKKIKRVGHNEFSS